MHERIKQIRIEQGLTQDDFGKRIGTARNTVANYECGRRIPTNAVITSICKEFGINKDWMLNGTEPMKKPIDDKLSAYVSEITDDDDEFIRNFIETYMELDIDSKAVIREFSKKMAEKYK